MKLLAKRIQHFLVDEGGPTAVEYAVMLALIVVVCMTAITTIGENARDSFLDTGEALGTLPTSGAGE